MTQRNVQTFYGTWPSEDMPGYIVIACFDRRFIKSDLPLSQQLQNALFYDEMPATFAMNVGAGIIQAAVSVATAQAVQMRESYYSKIAEEHQLSPTDPEQLARLNAIISGIGAHDLDPTYNKPEAHHD